MSIPEVSEAVCETICCEVNKEHTIWERIAEDQPALQHQWLHAYCEIKESFGNGAGEAALRLVLLTYKAIEAQLEVDELECT